MNQGEIVIVRFPFADNPARSKRRPAIVVSNAGANGGQDVILAAITSSVKNDKFSFLLEDAFLSNPMPKVSEVRCHKLFTLAKRLIVRRGFSQLNAQQQKELFKKICEVLDPGP